MLQVCLSRCYICFVHMLQVFYLDVAYVCNYFSSVFMCSKRMFRMFKLFRTYVAIVLFECFKNRLRYYACYNVSDLLQLHVAAAGASCTEGRGAACVEGRGKEGSVEE
jgi:hypothetical protein